LGTPASKFQKAAAQISFSGQPGFTNEAGLLIVNPGPGENLPAPLAQGKLEEPPMEPGKQRQRTLVCSRCGAEADLSVDYA